MKKIINYVIRTIFIVSSISLASCGGGGGGGGGLPNPTAPGTGTTTSTITVSPTNPAPSGTFSLTIEIPDATQLYWADINLNYDNSIIEITNTTTPSSSILSGVLPDFSAFRYVPASLFDANDPNLITSFYDSTLTGFTTWTGTNGTICIINFNVLSATAVSTKIDVRIKYRFGPTGTTEQIITATKFINIV